MKARGIMVFDFFEQEWRFWIGQQKYYAEPGSYFELRIKNIYFPAILKKDTDWFISLEEIFASRSTRTLFTKLEFVRKIMFRSLKKFNGTASLKISPEKEIPKQCELNEHIIPEISLN